MKEAVEWLTRGDVRLAVPVKRDDVEGYELAHERLIPALRRIANKELTESDRANLLLDRRANEWQGSNRDKRYLLSWRELRLIGAQTPFLQWGQNRSVKQELLRASKRKLRFRFALAALSASLAITAALIWYGEFSRRSRAEQQANSSRRLLQFTQMAQMKLVQLEFENANIDRVEELLATYLPQPGQEDLRGFEWQLLWQLSHSESFRLSEGRPVAAVTFLPDGRTLAIGETLPAKASGGSEYLIRLYDPDAQREISSFTSPTGDIFTLIAFSPDCRLVAVDGPERNVLLFDLHSGRLVTNTNQHERTLSAIAFAPSGQFLATGDQNGSVKIWDIAAGVERSVLKRNQDGIKWVTFSPDSRLLVSTDGTQTASLWDVASGRELAPVEISGSELSRVWFFPDGNRFLTATAKGELQFVDARTRRVVAALKSHTGEVTAEVTAAAFTPDGKRLATGSADHTIRLWDAATGEGLATIRGHSSTITAVAWSKDSHHLVTGSDDGDVKIWDVDDVLESSPPAEPVARYLATAFTPARELLALGVTGDNRLKLWNLSTGRELALFDEAGGNVLCAAFSPDNRLLATGGMDHKVRIWDAAGKLLHTLTGHQSSVFSVDFAPDGQSLVTGGEDRTLRLWDMAAGRELGQLEGGAENFYRADFAPDGRRLASACRDGGVKLWDLTTRTIVKTFVGHTDRVRAIAFSHDGRLLATGGKDNTVKLWDVAGGNLLMRLGRSDTIQRAAFSADNRRLVTGGTDGTVKIWDVITRQELIYLKGHADAVTSLSFSAGGLDLATSGADGTVRLWRTARALTPR